VEEKTQISFLEDPVSILLKIIRLNGRDLNLHDLFLAFKAVLLKGKEFSKAYAKEGHKQAGQLNVSQLQMQEMFVEALNHLKYLGFVSQTRQSTFQFRRNIYGKPSIGKHTGKTEKMKERDNAAI
jgi:hypothetical protein